MSIWNAQLSKAIRRGTPLFHYSYWNSYRVSHHVLQHSPPTHRVALNQIWEERERSGIWLSVVCPVSVCTRAIVRRHHVRRVRAALAAVFSGQGLDRNGKVMDSQTSSFQGTLHVVLLSPIVQSKGSEIRQQCATMVHQLLKDSQRRQALSSSKEWQQPTKGSSNSSRTLNHGEGSKSGNKKPRQIKNTENAFNNDHTGKPTFRRYDFSQTLNLVRKGANDQAAQHPDAVAGWHNGFRERA
ncbi:hypothetical protein Vi05172_g13018 [Venturia inaequalis]|nr:hypothetical protein Vi05172_g13018 [Venturia inaequalis]